MEEGKKGEGFKVIMSEYDQVDMQKSIDYLLDIIETETKILNGDVSKIVVGGFS